MSTVLPEGARIVPCSVHAMQYTCAWSSQRGAQRKEKTLDMQHFEDEVLYLQAVRRSTSPTRNSPACSSGHEGRAL